jgi:hypothetical protein
MSAFQLNHGNKWMDHLVISSITLGQHLVLCQNNHEHTLKLHPFSAPLTNPHGSEPTVARPR